MEIITFIQMIIYVVDLGVLTYIIISNRNQLIRQRKRHEELERIWQQAINNVTSVREDLERQRERLSLNK